MKKVGRTFKIKDDVVIRDTFTIAGHKESQGPLKGKFDMVIDDDLWREDSWEKCELKLQTTAVENLKNKNSLINENIDLLI